MRDTGHLVTIGLGRGRLFARDRGYPSAPAANGTVILAWLGSCRAYLLRLGNCPVTACTVQGMACVRSGQAPAWPLVLAGVSAVVSGVKHDFACTLTVQCSCAGVNGQVTVPAGGHLKVPIPRVGQVLFRVVPPLALAWRIR